MSGYPGLAKACFQIALDNGGLNRLRPEKQLRRDITRWISAQPTEVIGPIDAWLSTLTDDDIETVCCGGADEPEQIALLEKAPPFTDETLNRYFDEVC